MGSNPISRTKLMKLTLYIVIEEGWEYNAKVFSKLDDAIAYAKTKDTGVYETVVDHPEIENKYA